MENIRDKRIKIRIMSFLLAAAILFTGGFWTDGFLAADKKRIEIEIRAHNVMDRQDFEFFGTVYSYSVPFWIDLTGNPLLCLEYDRYMRPGLAADVYWEDIAEAGLVSRDQYDLLSIILNKCHELKDKELTEAMGPYLVCQFAAWAVVSGKWDWQRGTEKFLQEMEKVYPHIKGDDEYGVTREQIETGARAYIGGFCSDMDRYQGKQNQYIPDFATKYPMDIPEYMLEEQPDGSFAIEFSLQGKNPAVKDFEYPLPEGWSYEYKDDSVVFRCTEKKTVRAQVKAVAKPGSVLEQCIPLGVIGFVYPKLGTQQKMAGMIEVTGGWSCYFNLYLGDGVIPALDWKVPEVEQELYREEFQADYLAEIVKSDAENGNPLENCTFQFTESFDGAQLEHTVLDKSQFELWQGYKERCAPDVTDEEGRIVHHDRKTYQYEKTYCKGHLEPVIGANPELSEEEYQAAYEEAFKKAKAVWQEEVDACAAACDFHRIGGDAVLLLEADRNLAYEQFISLKYGYGISEKTARDGYVITGNESGNGLVGVSSQYLDAQERKEEGENKLAACSLPEDLTIEDVFWLEMEQTLETATKSDANPEMERDSGTATENNAKAATRNNVSKATLNDAAKAMELQRRQEILERAADLQGYVLEAVSGYRDDIFWCQKEIENTRIKGEIYGRKEAAGGETELGDAVLSDALYGLFAREDMVHPDGKTGLLFQAGDKVAEARTDSYGMVSFSGLFLGKYYLKELEAPKGFEVSEEEIEIELKSQSQTVPVVSGGTEEEPLRLQEILIKQPVKVEKRVQKDSYYHDTYGICQDGFTVQYGLGEGKESETVPGFHFRIYRVRDLEETGKLVKKTDGSWDYQSFFQTFGEMAETLAMDWDTKEYDEDQDVKTLCAGRRDGKEPYYGVSRELPYGKYVIEEVRERDALKRHYRNGGFTEIQIPKEETDQAGNGMVSVVNEFVSEEIVIQKIDESTGELILHDGAWFRIYAAKRNLIQEDGGKLSGTGGILWKEDGTPVYEEKDLVTLKNQDGNEISLFRAFFTGKKENGQETVTGKLELCSPLGAGAYVLAEVEAPAGYRIGKPVAFEIYEDGIRYYPDGGKKPAVDGKEGILVKNDRFQVQVKKTEAGNPDKEVEGAGFTLFYGAELKRNAEGQWENVIFERDEEGRVTAAKIRQKVNTAWAEEGILDYGQQEIQAEVCLESSGEHLALENGHWYTKDMSGGNISRFDKETGLLYGEEEGFAAAYLADENGEKIEAVSWVGEIPGDVYLEPGIYLLEETQPPLEKGYVRKAAVPVRIDGKREIQEISVEDDYTRVIIEKMDQATGETLKGAHLSLYKAVKEEKDLTWKKGEKVESWVSEETGKEFSHLPPGHYILEEEKAPEGFLKGEPQLLLVRAVGGRDQIQGFRLENEPFSVEITKTDITGEKEVEGALLTVYERLENGEEGEMLYQWVSAGTPYRISYLPDGDYILREETAPFGYLRTEDIIFSVSQQKPVQKIVMKNDVPAGRLQILKTAQNGGRPLEGAEFKVRNEITGAEQVLITDENGIVEAEVDSIGYTGEDGRWKPYDFLIQEEKAPEGYLKDTENYRFQFVYKDSSTPEVIFRIHLNNQKKPAENGRNTPTEPGPENTHKIVEKKEGHITVRYERVSWLERMSGKIPGFLLPDMGDDGWGILAAATAAGLSLLFAFLLIIKMRRKGKGGKNHGFRCFLMLMGFTLLFLCPAKQVKGETYSETQMEKKTLLEEKRESVSRVQHYEEMEGEQEIPEHLVVELEDEERMQTVSCILTKGEVVKTGERWSEDFELPFTFHVFGAEYYRLGEEKVPYDHEKPDFAGYENILLREAGLSEEDYRITEAVWTGEGYFDDSGVWCRDGMASGSRRLSDYSVAYYGEVVWEETEIVYQEVIDETEIKEKETVSEPSVMEEEIEKTTRAVEIIDENKKTMWQILRETMIISIGFALIAAVVLLAVWGIRRFMRWQRNL